MSYLTMWHDAGLIFKKNISIYAYFRYNFIVFDATSQ